MKKTLALLSLIGTLGLTACATVGGSIGGAGRAEPPKPSPNPAYVEGAGSVWECKQQDCQRVR